MRTACSSACAPDEGMGKTQVSRIFKISRNTIDLWLKKREETGDYRAEVGYRAEDTILKSLT